MGLWGVMRQAIFALIFCTFLYETCSAVADPLLSSVAAGDTFTGTLIIDATTPLAFPFAPPPFLYAQPTMSFAWTTPIGR
jgi:hypothetical protein